MADFSVNNDKYHKQVKSLEPTDRSHASVFNERFQQLFDNTNFLHQGKAEKNGGDISEMIVESLETPDEKFPIPAAKESCKTFFGKTKKFFEDFKNWQTGVCLVGQIVNNCVTDRGDLPGSAAQLKVLMDLYTQLNSDLNDLINSIPLVNKDLNTLINNSLTRYSYADAHTISNAPSLDATAIYTRRHVGWVQQVAITQTGDLYIRTTWDNNGRYDWTAWSKK